MFQICSPGTENQGIGSINLRAGLHCVVLIVSVRTPSFKTPSHAYVWSGTDIVKRPRQADTFHYSRFYFILYLLGKRTPVCTEERIPVCTRTETSIPVVTEKYPAEREIQFSSVVLLNVLGCRLTY